MKRALNILGTVLIIGGVAILAYVIWGATHQQAAPAKPTWNKSETQKGKQIAAKLATPQPQKVAIPKSLSRKALPRPGSLRATRIVIPAIDVNAPVVETPPTNGEWEVADWAVGHLSTTPNPGGKGNIALSAHDDIKGELFKRLSALKPGDEVKLYTKKAVYTYAVVSQQAVDPSDIQVLAPPAKPISIITLITCTPYWVDTQRLVVQAVLKSRAAV